MSRTLDYLVAAVRDDLGDDVAGIFGSGFIERALNEGQGQYAPDLLRSRVLEGVTIAVDATSYALPADAIDVERFEPEYGSGSPDLPSSRVVDGTVYFSRPVPSAWTGRLFYRAAYPDITDAQPCLLPAAAADGLIQFALYRCFRRLAAGRAEFRQYATIVGNAVSMADLEQSASIHFDDYQRAGLAGRPEIEPATFYDEC